MPAVIFSQSANLSGTIFTNNLESDIRIGGETIEIKLSGFGFFWRPVRWDSDIGKDSDVTEDLIDGFSGDENFDDVTEELNHRHIERVDDYLVRITLPEVPDYDLDDEDETIEVIIPSSCLTFYSEPVSAAPDIIIKYEQAAATINDPGLKESTLDGSELIITLKEEEFKNSDLQIKNFTHNGPDAISINAVNYVSETKAVITLGLDGALTDNINNFRITVSSKELEGDQSLTTNGISITSQSIPFIIDVTIPEDTYIIGELVKVLISVNDNPDSEYKYYSGTVAGKELTNLQKESNSLYSAYFTVEEGDADYSADQNIPVNNLRLSSGSLIGKAYNGVINNATIIDANAPVVSKISVDNGTYYIGDRILVDIEADGNNYTAVNGTQINGIPLSHSSVSFVNISGGQYRLSYNIQPDHPGVLPGDLEIVLYLEDAAGNIGGPYSDVDPNSLSIYTILPTAVISGDQTICEGETANLNVNLTGESPWRIYLSDGDDKTEHNINESPSVLNVSPRVNTVYSIDSVFDGNGTPNAGEGSATVTVIEKTDVEITNTDTIFSLDADPVLLEAVPSGGTFTGPGVDSSTDYFDPGKAGTFYSPHTLYYSYTNNLGCTSVDSTLIYIVEAEGEIRIPRDLYCDYDAPFKVTASNVAEVTGSFILYNEENEEVDGLTDNGDNTASVNPAVPGEGTFTIEYKYFSGTQFSIRSSFQIESPGNLEILIPDQDEYCLNEVPFTMSASDPAAVFSGPGVSGNPEDGFIFNPASAQVGDNTITLTNTTASGCEASVSKTIEIIKVPALSFTVDKLCTGSSDTVFFTNTTMNKHLISEWNWNFDDPNSGDNNTSTEEAPWHIFEEAGVRNIMLTGETSAGCVDTLAKTISFEDNPTGTFILESECFEEGTEISLYSEMKSSSEIQSYEWTITNSSGEVETISGGPSIEYIFDKLDRYSIRLDAETSVGCSGVSERVIVFKPTFSPGDSVGGYYEDFTEDNFWWSPGQADTSNHLSWDYSMVEFSALGNNRSQAWYTNLPSTPVQEHSWVKSPCFNFSSMDRPMIALDIYRSLSENDEGVVLQATTDDGDNWQTIGGVEGGINWYNSGQIDPGPGGGTAGWTGNDPFKADSGWIRARHDLSLFGGERKIQFRIVFASGHSNTETDREGFAFDNIRIKERNRKALIEHFTNSSADNTREIDGRVNSIYNGSFKDAVKLEYHTSFPGSDPFNSHNSSVPATRSFYYGVSEVPYSLVDGGYNSDLRFGYDMDMMEQKDLKIASLKDGLFDIEITADYKPDKVHAEVQVTALDDLEPAERIVHILVFEKLITGVSTVNGATNFLNVVKEMLPNSAGTAVFDEWEKGQSRSYQYSWDYKNVYDPDMIRVAAFIQNDETKEVYQVEADDSTNLTTSVKDVNRVHGMIVVYPNPAKNHLFISVEAEDRRDYTLELYDQTGRIMKQLKMYSFENQKKIDLTGLDKGVYLLRFSDGRNGVLKVEKVVILE